MVLTPLDTPPAARLREGIAPRTPAVAPRKAGEHALRLDGPAPAARACPHRAARRQTLYDQLGVVASTLCLVHCLALPLVLPLLTAGLGSWAAVDCCQLGGLSLHGLMFAVVAPLGAMALGGGYRQHRRFPPLVLGLAGIALLAAGLSCSAVDPGGMSQRLFTLAGSLGLIVAHVLNQRGARCC